MYYAMAAGGNLAVLFMITIVSLSHAHTEGSNARPCEADNNMEVTWEFKPCTTDIVKDFQEKVSDGMDKATVISFLQRICTEGVTKSKKCLADSLIGCDATIQEKFNRAASKGFGFLCLPDGTGLEPAWYAAFNSIDDGNLMHFDANNVECQDDFRVCREHLPFSRHIVLNSSTVGSSINYTVTNIERKTEAYIRCKADMFHAKKEECPEWRKGLLRVIVDRIFRLELGVRMPFSKEEVAEMFEYSAASALKISHSSVLAILSAWMISAICVADIFHL